MSEIERQKFLQLVTRKLVSLTAGCLALLLIIYFVVQYFAAAGQGGTTWLILFVFAGGLIGGFVSIQQRMPSIALDELRELADSWLSILLIPVNGGVFAIILMLMFLAGILQGAMFPEFVHPSIDTSSESGVLESFSTWLDMTFPKTGPDIAKLFFWSFVAGFSERFVPQIIRKTAQDAEQQDRKAEIDDS